MSDDFQYIDVDSEDFEDAPRALREHVKKLQSRDRELNSELGKVREQVVAHSLSDALNGKGFKNPERVKRAIMADKIDVGDSNAVNSWIESNGDDFARAVVEEPEAEPVADDADRGDYESLNVGGAGRDPASMSAWERAKAEITPEMDGEAVLAVYGKHGI
ncbi:MAG: hypothetical protein ACRDRL_15260 [Sciscionella sp.]